ncbi:MAG: S8 family serine peptidase [Kiritimatiellae bacterium]|nr:S8 family serine peptidase [Kiritimatiellia bacterium]
MHRSTTTKPKSADEASLLPFLGPLLLFVAAVLIWADVPGRLLARAKTTNSASLMILDDFAPGDEHGRTVSETARQAASVACDVIEIDVFKDRGIDQAKSTILAYMREHPDKRLVINMSFGCYGRIKKLDDLIVAISRTNVIAVAGAGNDNTSLFFYPAAYPSVIAVAACDQDGEKMRYSNYGVHIQACARPARALKYEDETTEFITGMMRLKAGTSYSAPRVSGILCLLWNLAPNASRQDILTRLASLTRASRDASLCGAPIVDTDDLHRKLVPRLYRIRACKKWVGPIGVLASLAWFLCACCQVGEEMKEKKKEEEIRKSRTAAQEGGASAMFSLAERYESGHGVASNTEKAVEWYQKAAEAGDERAKNALRRLARGSRQGDADDYGAFKKHMDLLAQINAPEELRRHVLAILRSSTTSSPASPDSPAADPTPEPEEPRHEDSRPVSPSAPAAGSPRKEARLRCRARTKSGAQCGLLAQPGSAFCHVHQHKQKRDCRVEARLHAGARRMR